MKIWFPAVRTGSGSDVFVNRLLQGLSEEGHKVCVSWFNHWNEIFPLFMSVGESLEG